MPTVLSTKRSEATLGGTPLLIRGPRIHAGERLSCELAMATAAMRGFPAAVAVMGDERAAPRSEEYRVAWETGKALAERGITVLTYDEPGIMTAAAEGARAGGIGKSVGLRTVHPLEQVSLPRFDLELQFEHFASRRAVMRTQAKGYIVLGYMDELVELLSLLTGAHEPVPVVLHDRAYWEALWPVVRDRMKDSKLLPRSQISLFRVADTVQEIVAGLRLKSAVWVRSDAVFAEGSSVTSPAVTH